MFDALTESGPRSSIILPPFGGGQKSASFALRKSGDAHRRVIDVFGDQSGRISGLVGCRIQRCAVSRDETFGRVDEPAARVMLIWPARLNRAALENSNTETFMSDARNF